MVQWLSTTTKLELPIIIQIHLKVRKAEGELLNRIDLIFLLITGPEPAQRTRTLQQPYKISGDVYRYDSGDEDNFSQATTFWNNTLDEAARKRLVSNIAGHLINAQGFLQERAISNFSKVSADFGKALTEAINLKKTAKM